MKKQIYAKGLAYGCTLAMMLAMMTGCSTQTNTKATAASDDSIYVQVTAVDENTITADQGDWQGPDTSQMKEKMDDSSDCQAPPESDSFDGQKPDGNPPNDKASDEKASDENNSDEKTTNDDTSNSSDNDNNKPDGNPPGQNDGKMGSPFTSNGESTTFTVTDDTKIVAESRDGEEEKSLSDISTDSILKVELDSNNQAVKITIMPTFGGDHGGPGSGRNGSQDQKEDRSTDDSQS